MDPGTFDDLVEKTLLPKGVLIPKEAQALKSYAGACVRAGPAAAADASRRLALAVSCFLLESTTRTQAASRMRFRTASGRGA